jgi:membrane-associated phospholipid phosphatase
MLKKKIARIISEVFNGFLTMILTPLISILLSPLDFQRKAILGIIYVLIPLLPYLLLRKLGLVSDYEFSKRKERPVYFFTLSILFGLTYLFVNTLGNEILSTISLNIFLVSTVISFITLLWKISGHMTYSTLLFTTVIFLIDSPYLLLLFLFTPLIAWSRIVLGKHTLTQTMLGTLITLFISILIYWGF